MKRLSPSPRIDHQRDIGAKCQILAVSEIGDPLDAEYQRDAHARERQDRARDDPVDRKLGEMLKHVPGRSS